MNISEATERFEALFPIVDTTTIYGPDIEVVVSGGAKAEGEHFPVLCRDKEHAARLWLDAAIAYKAQHEGNTLFWREKPEICEIILFRDATDRPEGGYAPAHFFTVYSRLAVRNTP